MRSYSKNTRKKMTAILGLPFLFLLTHCAEHFDPPTKTGAPKATEEVAAGLTGPSDVVIVPDSAATAPGKSLHHNDLLVANSEDHTIVQVNQSVEPHPVAAFADQNDTPHLNQPTGIAIDTHRVRGDIYITNFLGDDNTVASGGAITVFDKDGTLNRVIDHVLFQGAKGIVYDSHHSSLSMAVFYVSNMANNTILKVDVTSTTDTVTLYADMGFLGLGGDNPAQLAISPVDPHPLYTANSGLRSEEGPVGSTITVLPTDSSTIPVPSNEIRLIAAGEISGPVGLDFDDEGHLYTAAHESGTLVMIDPQIGFRIAAVETDATELQGISVGDAHIYLTVGEGGRVIKVSKNLLTADSGHEGDEHAH